MTKALWFFRIYAAICLVLAGLIGDVAVFAAHIAKPGPEPQILSLVNATGEDVLSMGFQTGRNMHFVRLDMPPGGKDDIENPGALTNLRVDTGLALWLFKDVPLNKAQTLTLRMGDKPVLELAVPKAEPQRIAGEAQSLLPGPDAGPVCALDRFRPGMPMKDVCALLSATPQRDDNDAVLASLGFAGMVWAARLEPAWRGLGATPPLMSLWRLLRDGRHAMPGLGQQKVDAGAHGAGLVAAGQVHQVHVAAKDAEPVFLQRQQHLAAGQGNRVQIRHDETARRGQKGFQFRCGIDHGLILVNAMFLSSQIAR